jgi:hypothetical protein
MGKTSVMQHCLVPQFAVNGSSIDQVLTTVFANSFRTMK